LWLSRAKQAHERKPVIAALKRKTIAPDDVIGDVVACADDTISCASNLCDPFGRRPRADACSADARSTDP
jgi:hypothetical protein